MYSKWKSRRFLVAVWAVLLVSYIVVFKTAEWMNLAVILVTLIVAFVGSETITKKWFASKEGK